MALLGVLSAIVAAAILSSTTASAAVVHPYLCQITGKAVASSSECYEVLGVKTASPTPAGGFSASSVFVDDSSGPTEGDVYVSDSTHKLIDRFHETGEYNCQITGKGSGATEPVSECNTEAVGPGEFGNTQDQGIADPSNGDVWIPDKSKSVLDLFNSAGKWLEPKFTVPAGSFAANPYQIALDHEGFPFAADSANKRIEKLANPATGVWSTFASGFKNVWGVAVDNSCSFHKPVLTESTTPTCKAFDPSNSDVYVSEGNSKVIDKLSPSGSLICEISGQGSTSTLPNECDKVNGITTDPGAPGGAIAYALRPAIDPASGAFYVVDFTKKVVDEFSSTGVFMSQITLPGPSTPKPEGVAVNATGSRVYVADTANKVVDVFETAFVPDAVTGEASDVTATGATLNGTVNPHGTPLTKCKFEWSEGSGASWEHEAICEEPGGAEVLGNSPVSVHARISGLQAGKSYRFRLVAENIQGSGPGLPSEFTVSTPLVDAEWATGVSDTAAQVHAEINAMRSNTTYRFEYGLCVSLAACAGTAYDKSLPLPEGGVGAAFGDVTVGVALSSLAPNSVYHYRVVATNLVNHTDGEERFVITQRTGPTFALPDRRAWELVSPPDKHGALLREINEAGVIQAAVDGSAITYWAFGTPEAEPQGSLLDAQMLAVRGARGWTSRDIATPHDAETTFVAGGGGEYRFFSPDLFLSLVEPKGAFTPFTGEMFPEATERTPYVRHDSTCTTEPATCYEPLVTGAPGYEDVPAGTKFGGNPPGKPVLAQGAVVFWDATPDLSHVILKPSTESELNLTSPPVKNALYEWSAAAAPTERLQLVSVLPDGTESGSNGLGYNGNVIRHAISNDGSRVFFSSEVGGKHGLYMRDTATRKSVRLDVVQPGSEEAQRIAETSEPRFQIATVEGTAVDGTRALFTDSQRLTANAGKGGSDLYECVIVETASKLECKLTDLTPESAGERAEVQGAVLGTSEDGSYVYLVANGAFAAEAVKGGCNPYASLSVMCNLYMLHYDGEPGVESWEAPQLVAVLSNGDMPDWAGHSGGTNLEQLTSRVSPDGGWLAFMSGRSLTGYDNHDASSGNPDEEVFLYHAPSGAGEEGKLTCASCNPTGARPVGVEEGSYPRLVDGNQLWSSANHSLAANIPGWTPFTGGTAAYQSRYLSSSGRLFFNSSDALAPQDVNNNEDVYEYEPPGVGGCTTSSPSYSERDGGCVDLISSGVSSRESAFLDASESGNDVFFLTAAKLAAQDKDTALDVYDAHVCSGEAPCIAESPSPPACTTTDSCRAAPVQQPSLFGAPPSATFSGGGNLAPPSKQVVKPKALTRAQKLAQALRVCRKKRNRKKRAACERQARRRYGAKSSRRAAASKGGRR